MNFEIQKYYSRLLVFLWILAGCTQNDPLIPPPLSLGDATVLGKSTLLPLEGIYTLSSGNDGLGTEFVCRVTRNTVSFFGNRSGIFIILHAGLVHADSSILFIGFWRVSEKASQGTIQFTLSPKDAAQLLHQHTAPGLVLDGVYPANQKEQKLTLRYDRDFPAAAKAKPLAIFGHHGIETNANPPFVENSLNAMRHVEDYGATGIEVDIRLTKDNVPVLFHDPDLNIRVVEKSGILANLDQVSYNTLFNFVRLHDGQRIPSLEEALRIAVDSTDLQYVWLDIKGNPNVFKYLEPVVRAAIANAQSKGRVLEIITDIPTDDVMTEYAKQPTYATLPVMCELELDKTLSIKSGYWGPRWTLGLVLDEVDKAHAQGLKVFAWTLNSESIITSYLRDGRFDGMITDYPAYSVYHYYTMN
jgi:glycerophosphoryl diester phosphodiesterase